jgi:hypothetical protein
MSPPFKWLALSVNRKIFEQKAYLLTRSKATIAENGGEAALRGTLSRSGIGIAARSE